MAIAVAGHLCVDITPRLDGHDPGLEPGVLYAVGPLRQQIGGSVANTGGTLTRLGHDVRLHACVGDDELGGVCRRQLAERVRTLDLTTTSLGTSYSIVIEHPRHDRTFWQYEGANADFDPRGLELAEDVNVLHVGYPSLVPSLCADPDLLADAFRDARSRGIVTSLDLAHVADGSVASRVDWLDWFARTVAWTDIWSPSWDDVSSALGLTGEATPERLEETAAEMLSWGAAVVSLSAGTGGFILRTADADRIARAGEAVASLGAEWADRSIWFPAETVESPETTVGAGDALTAGLLDAIVRGLDPQAAGEHARAVVGRHLRGEALMP